MSNPLLPPAPYASPVINNEGILTHIWAKWFNQLFLRAGGLDTPALNTVSSSLTTAQSSLTSLTATVQTNNGLGVGRPL